MTIQVAYFITSHGFGHAARACAVMAAVHRLNPQVVFEIYTGTPRWFFEESVPGCFNYHETFTDVGLVQSSPMTEDLSATLKKLEKFLPISIEQTGNLKDSVTRTGCRLVICDISPLGLAVARAAGVPSVLIENFTWDWIYECFTGEYPAFTGYIEQFKELFLTADYHIQTEPVCRPAEKAALTTHPVFREPHTPKDETRRRLGIPANDRMVLVTMGGVPEKFAFLKDLSNWEDITIVIPGGSSKISHQDGLILLPHHSRFYHPDLVFASDAVVGKAGYSTIAETYHAGIPFGFVSRPRFRESDMLAIYIRKEIPGFELSETEFSSGRWSNRLDELLDQKRIHRDSPNGAEQASGFVLKVLP